MTLPPPVRKGRDRLDRTLADALPDLAWLMRLYLRDPTGGALGTQMADLHARINELREAMAREARTDEEQP